MINEDEFLPGADLYPEERLAAAIIRVGLKLDGPDFVTESCGVAWAELAGLDPELLYRLAAPEQDHEGIPYQRTDVCEHFKLGERVRTCRHGVVLRGYATASQL